MASNRVTWLVLLLHLAYNTCETNATVALPRWFSDNMVLQADTQAFLSGMTSPPGEWVSVSGDVGELSATLHYMQNVPGFLSTFVHAQCGSVSDSVSSVVVHVCRMLCVDDSVRVCACVCVCV